MQKLLFSKSESSLNLFLILPILICLSLGCLCPREKGAESCVTTDGANLVMGGSTFRIIKLTDGTITATDSAKVSNVLCLNNNEIISVKEAQIEGENKSYNTERTAVWKNSQLTHKLANDESLESYQGFIQNKYFVSSSRHWIYKTFSSPGGKSSYTRVVYTEPQTFNLEDSTNGKLTSHIITLDKLKLPKDFDLDFLRFYTLNLAEDGTLKFVVNNSNLNTFNLYKLNMFDGVLTQIGGELKPPARMTLDSVVSDKPGKFYVFTYSGLTEKGGARKLIRVQNVETNQDIITKTIEGVSFNGNGVKFVFDANSQKLAMLIFGFRFDPTRRVNELTVYNLQNGNEMANIDAQELFKQPDGIELLALVGDELILNYSIEHRIWNTENFIGKVNLVNKQIIWSKELK